MKLEYTEANRQQLIVRQSCMDRAVTALLDQGELKLVVAADVKASLIKIESLTNALESIIINPR